MDRKRKYLEAIIENEALILERIIHSYVIRMGLAADQAAQEVAREILSDTTVTAIECVHSYDPTRRPVPWLLGIALNQIRRRIQNQQRSREILVRDLYSNTADGYSDDELFERFALLARDSSSLEVQENITAFLEPLSAEDQQIIRLAILEDLNSAAIAHELAITPAAARVRLHRALKRLRNHITLSGELL